MNGATESTIAALLRHSGTALVKRYAHLSPSHLKEAVEKVARFGKNGSHEAQGRKEDLEEEELHHRLILRLRLAFLVHDFGVALRRRERMDCTAYLIGCL